MTATRALAWTFILTLCVGVTESIGFALTGSLTLLSDVSHLSMDLISVAVAFIARYWSQKAKNAAMNFGYGRYEVIASLFNAALLIVMSLHISWESLERFGHTRVLAITTLCWVLGTSVAINALRLYMLHAAQKESAAVYAIYIESYGDLLNAVLLLLSVPIMHYTQWFYLDPLLGLCIALWILYRGYLIFYDSLQILLEKTPSHISYDQVVKTIQQEAGVSKLNSLHIWSVAPQEAYLMASVCVSTTAPHFDLVTLKSKLQEDFQLTDVCIEQTPVEPSQAQ